MLALGRGACFSSPIFKTFYFGMITDNSQKYYTKNYSVSFTQTLQMLTSYRIYLFYHSSHSLSLSLHTQIIFLKHLKVTCRQNELNL